MKKDGNKKKRRVWGSILVTVLVIFSTLSVTVLAGLGVIIFQTDSQGDMTVMETMRVSRTTRLYAPSNGAERKTLTLENYTPVEVDILFGNENMIWAQSDEIPDTLREAFIAIEDQGFYEHRGVEWKRTAYAALNQILHFRPRFGGSTITQQLIKNVHGDRDVSIVRKIKEIVRALRLERTYTKDEILTYYLNIVPLGHGCVGVKSAARYYFDKSPMELTVEECATLASITNSPVKYDPVARPENNTARRKLVLGAMRECGYLTEEVYRVSKAKEVQLNITDPVYTDHTHNWYIETVISDVTHDLIEQLGISEGTAKAMLYRGGLEIYTLMDPAVQAIMDQCFADGNAFTDETGRQIEGGMTVCDPASGDLLGVIGGIGEKSGSRLFNRACDGYYQPGSVLKPLALYAPAIENNRIHYASIFEDLPEAYEGSYWPHNSPDVYMGQITAAEALARSKNTVAVALLKMLGEKNVYRHLKNTVGLTGLVSNGTVSDIAAAPLALGQLSYGTTVRELTNAYGSFANGGEMMKGRSYLAVFDAKGAPLLKNKKEAKRVWSSETAYIMTRMMQDVVERGTAHRITLKEVVDTAGKTGTSGADKDKWFIGYTPYYVAGLHLAYDDRAPLSGGERRHLTVWDEVMQKLHEELLSPWEEPREFSQPEGVVQCEYCLDSGCIPTEACHGDMRGDRTAIGYFKTSCMPMTECDTHVVVHYSISDGRYKMGNGTEEDIDTYMLSLPKRQIVMGIQPQDAPYTIEYWMEEYQKEDLPGRAEEPPDEIENAEDKREM